jgi:hypothetical protein
MRGLAGVYVSHAYMNTYIRTCTCLSRNPFGISRFPSYDVCVYIYTYIHAFNTFIHQYIRTRIHTYIHIRMQTSYKVVQSTFRVSVATISETTRVNGVENNITISFQPTISLPPKATITISGFENLPHGTGAHCLSGPGAYKFSCNGCLDGKTPRGMWSADGRDLVLTIRNDSHILSTSPTVSFRFRWFCI